MDREADSPTIICAGCGKVTARHGAAVSHGICQECALRILEDTGVLRGEPNPVSEAPQRQEPDARSAAS